jgi:hypothetical protein
MGAAIFSNLKNESKIIASYLVGHSHYETSTIFMHPGCKITFDENFICHFAWLHGKFGTSFAS